jgi:hypothetical protein
MPAASRSKTWALGRALAGIVGSKPNGGMDVYLLWVFVCCQVEVSAMDWSLVQRSPTECGVSEYDLETFKRRRPMPHLGCRAIGKESRCPAFCITRLVFSISAYSPDSTDRMLCTGRLMFDAPQNYGISSPCEGVVQLAIHFPPPHLPWRCACVSKSEVCFTVRVYVLCTFRLMTCNRRVPNLCFIRCTHHLRHRRLSPFVTWNEPVSPV